MANEILVPEQWLTLYGDILYRYAFVRVRSVEIAEDLVQETLLAGLTAKENFAGQASEQTGLIGILKHKIINSFRKSAQEKIEGVGDRFADDGGDEFFDRQGNWQIDLSSWSRPDKSLEQEQFLIVLEDCLGRLPPRMAQLFMLRELDGIESEEICEVMAISSLNNFWVMISRVRVQLRHCLDLNWFGQ